MSNKAFQIVIAGCTGGPRETNLSSYLLSPLEEQQWIALDAGSLLSGIDSALGKNNLGGVRFSDPELSADAEMLGNLQCYLISHAHLDHIAGLVLNSQIDNNKYILGIDPTINNIRDHIFNGTIWPNYGSEGVEPVLRRYEYVRLPLHKPQNVPNTSLTVEAYLLSHPHGYPSTAFLLEYKQHYLLYFGDTSSDMLEVEKHLNRIWRRIAPLVNDKKLHCILLECSYSQKDAAQVIYGHLDTKLMMQELHHLAEIANTSLQGLNVIVTHRKDSLHKGPDTKETIKEELIAMNDLGINFIFPSQGDRYIL